MIILLFKSYVHPYDRKGPGGSTVHVEGHTDRRTKKPEQMFLFPEMAPPPKKEPKEKKPAAPKKERPKPDWYDTSTSDIKGAIGTVEHEGVTYSLSLRHEGRAIRFHMKAPGGEWFKVGARLDNGMSTSRRSLGGAVDYLKVCLDDKAKIKIDLSKPAAEEKPKAEAKPAEPDHIRNMRAKLKQLKGARSKSASDEKIEELYKRRLDADPAKWKAGDGVAWGVMAHGGIAQWNRGFRIVEVSAPDKMALIRSVADTGLTTTGGHHDRIGDEWVYLGDLKRENRYNG